MARQPFRLTLLACLVLAGCFQTEFTGTIRSTGSFRGDVFLGLPRRVQTDPQFKKLLNQQTMPDFLRAQGAYVAQPDPESPRYRVAAAAISQLNLPWQRHEFIATDNDRYSYVGMVTLPTVAVTHLRDYMRASIGTAGKLGPRAALAAAQIAKSAAEQSLIKLDLSFPGEITFTNGRIGADGHVRWTWQIEDLQDHRPRYAIVAGTLPWYAPLRDGILDLF